MLSKPVDTSARIAEKRVISATAAPLVLGALSVLLGTLVFAGQAGAAVSETVTLASVAPQAPTAVRASSMGQTATSRVAPTEAATQGAGSIVASPTRAVASSATPSAGQATAPLSTAAAQSIGSTIRADGSVAASAKKLIARAVSSATQTAVNLTPPATAVSQRLGASRPVESVASTASSLATARGPAQFLAPTAANLAVKAGSQLSAPVNAITPSIGQVRQQVGATARHVVRDRKLAPATPGQQPPIATLAPPPKSGAGAAPASGASSGEAPLERRNRPSGVAACGLAGHEGRLVHRCRSGGPRLPGGPRTLLRVVPYAPPLAFADGAVWGYVSIRARGGSPSVGRRSSPGSSHPPGGVSGSSLGAVALACAISIALAGIWLFGRPRTIRRLARAAAPPRAAPFVLMPERPG